MKNTITILLVVAISSLSAQIPQNFNYQAIARNAQGQAIANKQIILEISILQGNNCPQNPSSCNVVWQEIHFPTTNSYGMFNINIGTGQKTFASTVANFSDINWTNQTAGKYYLRTRADFGDTPYLSGMVDLGTVEFSSVPYALSSQNAVNLIRQSNKVPILLQELDNVHINNPTNNQLLLYNGTDWVNSNLSLTIPSNLTDLSDVNISSPANNQVLLYNGTSWVNNVLNISNLGGVSINSPQSGQALVYNGTNWENQNPLLTDNGTFVYYNTNRKLGFWTTTPTASFHINIPAVAPHTAGTFTVSGTYDASNTGNIDVSGAGTRMFFSPARSAFRAGTVDGTQWNTSSVGNYSFAAGYNTTASGNYSFAFGRNSSATNTYSVVFGYNNTASGVGAFVMGESNTVTEAYALSMGVNNNVTANYCFTLGIGLIGNSYGSLVLGRYNKNNGAYNPTSWTATDPILIVGNGTSTAARNNSLIIRKNGDIVTEGTLSQGQTNPGKNILQIKSNELLNLQTYYDNTNKRYLIDVQTILKYFPDLVFIDENSYYVNYIGLIPVAVETIKQQQQQIEQLKADQQKLQEQLKSIEERLKMLENK